MIYIQQGGYSRTGRYVPKVWCVHQTGRGVEEFTKLLFAKQFAVQQGASGKWRRSVEHSGVRGAPQVRYDDAKEPSE